MASVSQYFESFIRKREMTIGYLAMIDKLSNIEGKEEFCDLRTSK